MTKQKKIYTIGHSNHEAEYFLELLEYQAIDCLIDVRTTPASAYCPHFNKEPLKNYLQASDIVYMHFGKEFGARQETGEVLNKDGRVNFQKVQQTTSFQIGVERVQKGLDKGFTIALMCSEGNPLECHRFSMIANYLEKEGIEVAHILKDKTLVPHSDLEASLLKKYAKKLPQASLFEPNIGAKEQLEAAYRLHNQDIAWQQEGNAKIEPV